MNEKEALKEFDKIIVETDGDTEEKHVKLDNLIAEFLYTNGFKELSLRFKKEPVWYA